MPTEHFLVECLLRRPGGTIVEIGSNAYHFKPDSEGRHIAIVTERDHAKRLRDIPEAYKLHGLIAASDAMGAATDPAQPAPQPIQDDRNQQQAGPMTGSVGIPSTMPIAGKTETGINATGLHQDERQESVGRLPPAPVDDTPEDLAAASDDDLRALFEAEVGSKAHPRAGRDLMISRIKGARGIQQ